MGYYYYKKEVHVQVIRLTDDIFEGGNTVPRENVYI